MKIVLIRHGKTRGNVLRKYIGRTDESLCDEGKKQLQQLIDQGIYPKVEQIYASPMARCMETAQLIYGDQLIEQDSLLRECDFGLFEYKDYEELKDHSEYQHWLNSEGTRPFPEGEDPIAFRQRCKQGFVEKVNKAIEQGKNPIAFVVHGGTIMAILEQFAYPRQEFYQWQVGNGLGYVVNIEAERWHEEKVLTIEEKLEERSVE